MADDLDPAATGRWILAAADELARHSGEINALNVFPVADSDTGTNLTQTLRAAAAAISALDSVAGAHAGHVMGTAATAAVLGARGNSGVILAQLLRSLADAAAESAVLGAAELASGLTQAVTDAYSAVADPVEGTMLSVIRAAAAAADPALPLDQFAVAVVRAAEEALWHTTEQLAPLARAGVIDAGGLGLLVILDVLAETVTGAKVAQQRELPVVRPGSLLRAEREMGSADYEYEVQYLLDAEDVAIEPLRERLAEIGDSVVVVGAGAEPSDGDEAPAQTWNVHAHVSDVGAAIEAGLVAGRLHRISVISFAEEGALGPAQPNATSEAVLIVVAPEPGTEQLFAVEGVHVVPDVPTPERFVTSLGDVAAAQVVVFHAASHAAAIAEAVASARVAGVRVAVIPIRSSMQGLAAVAVHDSSRAFDDDVVAMAEAAAATRFGEVSVAAEDGLTSIGPCAAGDVLGLIDGEVVEIGKDVQDVSLSLADRVIGVGAELITLLLGADAPHDLGEIVTAHVRVRAPFTDVTVYAGGQPDRPLIIGIE